MSCRGTSLPLHGGDSVDASMEPSRVSSSIHQCWTMLHAACYRNAPLNGTLGSIFLHSECVIKLTLAKHMQHKKIIDFQHPKNKRELQTVIFILLRGFEASGGICYIYDPTWAGFKFRANG